MKPYTDPESGIIYNLFKEHLTELLARIAPAWDLHHMIMDRVPSPDFCREKDEVRITLVIRMGKFRGATREPHLPRLD